MHRVLCELREDFQVPVRLRCDRLVGSFYQNVPGRESSTCKDPEKHRSVCGTRVIRHNWNIAWVEAYAVMLERPDRKGQLETAVPLKDSRQALCFVCKGPSGSVR